MGRDLERRFRGKRLKSTSWGHVADWYHEMLETQPGTYQKEVILPNLLRLLAIKEGETILDLACGQGFFAREFWKQGARVIGVDISKELIALARENSPKGIEFRVGPADDLGFLKDGSVDKITVVLALQNIENVHDVFTECSRVLVPRGRLFVVINHPAFRIPKASSWGWEGHRVQYRRIDRYLTESKVKIQMHPGDDPDEYTLSYHRPLQFYFKHLSKNGLYVGRVEEWISNRVSQPGPRAAAENLARREIPLFLFMEAVNFGPDGRT